jgi:chorismate mutase/prephenate dehydratase
MGAGHGRHVAADQETLERIIVKNQGPLTPESVRAIFREVLSGARALVHPLKIAYLGPEYSYSHLAAVERFGHSAELVPVATIASVFEAVHAAQVDYGVVPVENSTDGRIADTLEMFARLTVRICGEVQLRIHHHLLANCPRSLVREVCSKPQALSQCREWISKQLPGAALVETSSTTVAAQQAAEKPGTAAIASRQAAVNYGLDVIASGIEDNKHNVTRFSVLGQQPAERSGDDKTSLMFELAHRPGALADAMTIFKRNRLNLTWIESFPIHGSANEYLFFVELEGHPSELRVRRAIASLQRKTVRAEILGSYARTQPVD